MRVANQEQCDKGRAVAERRGDGDWSDRFRAPAALAMLRAIRRSTGLRVFLSRQSSDFCCLHLIVECKPISVMLRFEYSLDLEVVTIAQGCGFLSIDNDAAATGGTSQ